MESKSAKTEGQQQRQIHIYSKSKKREGNVKEGSWQEKKDALAMQLFRLAVQFSEWMSSMRVKAVAILSTINPSFPELDCLGSSNLQRICSSGQETSKERKESESKCTQKSALQEDISECDHLVLDDSAQMTRTRRRQKMLINSDAKSELSMALADWLHTAAIIVRFCESTVTYLSHKSCVSPNLDDDDNQHNWQREYSCVVFTLTASLRQLECA